MPFKISRKDKLFRKLKRLAPEAGAALAKVNDQAADEMVALARSLAPVKTGRLRESIRKVPGPGRGSVIVKAGGPTTTKQVRAGSGQAFDYALAAEFGTSAHTNEGEFAGSRNPGARRQPFFFPSYRVVRKKHRGRTTRALNKSIKKVAGQ